MQFSGVGRANACVDGASATGTYRMSACGGIVLKNSFWGDVRKFLGQLMRLTRDDVRDHIISSKIDHRPPQWR